MAPTHKQWLSFPLPSPSIGRVPAGEIESAVIDQLRADALADALADVADPADLVAVRVEHGQPGHPRDEDPVPVIDLHLRCRLPEPQRVEGPPGPGLGCGLGPTVGESHHLSGGTRPRGQLQVRERRLEIASAPVARQNAEEAARQATSVGTLKTAVAQAAEQRDACTVPGINRM